jgi:hypothetical protein
MNLANLPILKGFVFDENDKVITRFSSLHNGMGNFAFTPQANTVYHARITKPESITSIYTLPDALAQWIFAYCKRTNRKGYLLICI